MTKKRNVFLAGALNFFSPGVGFLYVGKSTYAIGLPVVLLLLISIASWTKIIFRPEGILTLTAMAITFWLGSVIWASSIAQRQGSISLKRYQRWYVYLAFSVVTGLVGNVLGENRGELFGYELYRIPSGAMMPTLLIGDFIIVDANSYKSSETTSSRDGIVGDSPSRGDVIAFRFPEDPGNPYLMRVIGIPGDKIRYYEKTLYINDNPVEATDLGVYTGVGSGSVMTGASLYIEHLPGSDYETLVDPNSKSTESEAIVPNDHYFVLGDNRDRSRDSRYRGFVPRDHLIGKAVTTWMNSDFSEGRIDFSRIGKLIL